MQLIFGAFGILFFSLGAVGAFLPVLPTVPFLLLAAFCFARSSRKWNTWFLDTSLYKNYMGKMKQREMTRREKCSVIGSITLVMAFSFLMTANYPIVRVILASVWTAHLWFFVFRVKTVSGKEHVEPPDQVTRSCREERRARTGL